MHLIIGASGFIGRHLYDHCKKDGIDVLGTYYTHPYNPELVKFDICSDNLGEFCIRYLNGRAPEVVIICGANGNIDSCKKNEVESNLLNVRNTQRILYQANVLGSKCVYLSSEAVFDGKKGMYAEEDAVNPITVYGMQKLQVEQYMAQNIKDYLVFRISRAVAHQFGEKDIFDEFYNKMIRKEPIICLKNQSFCLTDIDDITFAILKALSQKLVGLYHLSSRNYISRYMLARLFGERIQGGYEKIAENEYESMSFVDNRGIYGGLRGDRLAQILDMRYKSVTDILDSYYQSGRSYWDAD